MLSASNEGDKLAGKIRYILAARDLHSMDETPGKTRLAKHAKEQGERLAQMGFHQMAKVFGGKAHKE